jgi:hypothetical protein
VSEWEVWRGFRGGEDVRDLDLSKVSIKERDSSSSMKGLPRLSNLSVLPCFFLSV